MRLWVDVLNASGTVLGRGPITALKGVSLSHLLDGAGEVSVTVPLLDQRVQELIANERRLRLWAASRDLTLIPGGSTELDYDAATKSGTSQVGFSFENAFDGSLATEWRTSATGFVNLHWTTEQKITSYSIQVPTITGGNTPRAWALRKKVGVSYVDIDTQTDQTFSPGETKTFTLPIEAASTDFELRFSASNGSEVRVAEVELVYTTADTLFPTPRELGTSILRNKTGQAQGGDLVLQGINSLDELRRINVLLGRSYNNADLTDVLDDLMTLVPGWTIDHTGVSGTLYADLSGVSVLKALQEIAKQTGYHFRLNGSNAIKFGSLGDESGLVLVQPGSALHPELDANTDVAVIKNITVNDVSEAVTNWIIPIGGGEGKRSLTLEHSTRPLITLASNPPVLGETKVELLVYQATGYTKLAQSFQVPETTPVKRMKVYTWRETNFPDPGTLTFRVETDSGGNASGTLVHADATLSVSEVFAPGGGYGIKEISFANAFTLNAGTPYWLVWSTTRVDDTRQLGWRTDNSGSYPGGEGKVFDGVSWATLSSNRDFCFEVFAEGATYPIQSGTGPDGKPYFYLSDSASVAAYGAIQQVISFEGIKPQGNTQAEIVAAANALYDAAAAWLIQNKDPQSVYTVSVTKADQIPLPGQLVRLLYKGYLWNRSQTKVTWLDTNALFYVVRATESHTLEGQTVDLELSNLNRRPVTVESAVAQAVEVLSVQALKYDPRMDAPPSLCGGRLSLSDTDPVPLSDLTAQPVLNFLPDRDNRVSLYTGSRWIEYVFPPLQLGLDTFPADTNVDVFLYDDQSTLFLEAIAWTTSTLGDAGQARAVALDELDGVLVKDGDPTHKYLGCFRTTAAGQGEDSLTKRFVWNTYNRRLRRMRLGVNNAHTYTSGTVRQWANLATFQLEFVLGVVEDAILAGSEYTVQAVAAGNIGRAGFALDRTNGFDSAIDYRATTLIQFGNNGPVVPTTPGAHYIADTQQSNGTGANYATGILTASVWG